MTVKTSKFNDILQKLKIITNKTENSLLNNLLKIPKRDNKINTPQTHVSVEDAIHQIDTLYLPNDKGYKYLLVVVDLATSKTDAEPLKSRDSKIVRDALKKIYSRKILKQPKILEVDSGSEFKGDFSKYYESKLYIRVKRTGRHRAQSVVEAKNKTIGLILNRYMLASELNTGEQSKAWIDILPKTIELINKAYSHKPRDYDGKPRCSGISCNIIPEGTRVRVILEQPRDIVTGKRLHGEKFRSGDPRWTQEIHKIEKVIILPEQPPMYGVSDIPTTGFTRSQLQIVKENEVKPLTNKWIVEKIVDKKIIKNKPYYLVKWKNYPNSQNTWEPRINLIEDVPEMILDYENHH